MLLIYLSFITAMLTFTSSTNKTIGPPLQISLIVKLKFAFTFSIYLDYHSLIVSKDSINCKL